MKHLYYFFTVAICMILMFSCDKKEKDLTLQGLWNEDVSAVYDTMNHSEIHNLVFDCDYVFSFVRTMHYRSGLDTANNHIMLSYDEYVSGKYTLEKDNIYFSGYYCIDSNYTIPADSLNTQYNYGQYSDTMTYVIDDKYLMLNLDAPEHQDINRFKQEQAYDDCGW